MSLVKIVSTGTSFTDDLMFCTVVQNNEKIATGIVERVTGRKVAKVIASEKQNAIKLGAGLRGVRFDVTFEDDDAVYNIEMQTCKEDDLLKRARLYSSVINVDHSKEGMRFSELRDTYVIFLELFDQFGHGDYVYHVRRKIDEYPGDPCNDGECLYFVNAYGTHGDAPDELKNFLAYLRTHKPQDAFTEEISKDVSAFAHNPQWRDVKMQYEYILARQKEKGAEKERENEDRRMKLLAKKLEENKSTEELLRVLSDPEFRRSLYKKYHIE